MEICMLSPSQRRELEQLVGRYNVIRVQIMEQLDRVIEQWDDEIVEDIRRYHSNDYSLAEPISRYDCIVGWRGIMETCEIDFSELDNAPLVR